MSVSQESSVPAGSSRGGALQFNAKAVTEPVTRASRRLYEAVATPVEWYVEQWEDLFVEAKASLASSVEAPTVANIMAGLAEAKVVSDAPGRVRLRLNDLKGRDALARQTAEALGSLDGIKQVEVSSLTGSVLLLYDTEQYPTRDAVVRAVSASV
jgi:hypothetical protein